MVLSAVESIGWWVGYLGVWLFLIGLLALCVAAIAFGWRYWVASSRDGEDLFPEGNEMTVELEQALEELDESKSEALLEVFRDVDAATAAELVAVLARAASSESAMHGLHSLKSDLSVDLERSRDGDELGVFLRDEQYRLDIPADDAVTLRLETVLSLFSIVEPDPANFFGMRVDDTTLQFSWASSSDGSVLHADMPILERGRFEGSYTGPIDVESAERGIEEFARTGRRPGWLEEKLEFVEDRAPPAPTDAPGDGPADDSDRSQPGDFLSKPDWLEGERLKGSNDDDLQALEHEASMNPRAVEVDVHWRLAREYWSAAHSTDDYRARRDKLKRSAFFVDHAVEGGLSHRESLETSLEMLEEAAEVHTHAAKLRRTQALARERLAELQPGRESYDLSRINSGEVRIDGGMCLLGDPETTVSETGPQGDDAMLEWMKEGTRLGFQTGDGVFPAEIRLLEEGRPRLGADELAKVSECTASIVLEVPSGRVALADIASLLDEEGRSTSRGLDLDVSPGGTFRACVYATPDGYAAVLARTEETPPNDVRSVDQVRWVEFMRIADLLERGQVEEAEKRVERLVDRRDDLREFDARYYFHQVLAEMASDAFEWGDPVSMLPVIRRLAHADPEWETHFQEDVDRAREYLEERGEETPASAATKEQRRRESRDRVGQLHMDIDRAFDEMNDAEGEELEALKRSAWEDLCELAELEDLSEKYARYKDALAAELDESD